MSWLYLIILIPFLSATFIPFLFKYVPRVHTGWFTLLVPAGLFAYLAGFIPQVADGYTFIHSLPWIPALGIDFTIYLDGLSLIFGLLISGIGALVILYSIFYMPKHREALHNFYVYLLLFMGSMLGAVFSDNVIVVYVFWELTSISSFLLIAFWYQRKKSRYGAQKALLITVLGGFAMLAGFLLLSNAAHTYSIRDMIAQSALLADQSVFIPAMLLILLGAFTKSAQFPFHIWLPDAMEAPTPISAYLHSATMVKAGIYVVARFTPLFGGTAAWFWLVSVVGLFTLFWGSFSAVKQTDLKALLAFSTISQLGMIMCLLGLGSAALYYGPEAGPLYTSAILAAIFHLINHSTFKGSLFMVVGIIDHKTGTRDIRKLGGLMNIMPVTFTMAAIGSFSMAGLPPFNGFLSKELFFTGVLNASRLDIFNLESWGMIFPVVAWIASVFTFIYCMILVFKTFLGNYQPQKLEKKPIEAPWGMLLSPAILAAFVILIFFFPNILADYLLYPAMGAILPGFAITGYGISPISAWHGLTPELLMTLGVIGMGTIMFIFRRKWTKVYGHLPARFTLNSVYDTSLAGTEKAFSNLTGRYMTGLVRDYLAYLFLFFILVLGGFLWAGTGFSLHPRTGSPVYAYEIILALVTGAAALSVPFTRSRLMAVISVGVIGYMVSMFFVIFRAPDLALTQLVVETVTTVLFLLCFHHLPELKKTAGRLSFKITNLLISLGVGIVATVLALAVQNHRLFAPISWFFEDAYELAGAKNIVNAILVDFRGFDTMLEILVFFIAGIGVYTLIKLRLAGGNRHEK